MLTRVAQDAERALRAVEQTDGLLDDEQVAEAYQLLRELVGQDFDIDEAGVPRLHRGTASGRIISTVDTEMRHGRKSSSQRFGVRGLLVQKTGLSACEFGEVRCLQRSVFASADRLGEGDVVSAGEGDVLVPER